MATDTKLNLGYRREIAGLGERNFETSGTVLYKSVKRNLFIGSTAYQYGDNIPFDGPGATSYLPSTMEQLEFYWNQEFIEPIA